MKSTQLLDDLEFHDPAPFAQPILVDQNSRILRWMLKPGQQIEALKCLYAEGEDNPAIFHGEGAADMSGH